MALSASALATEIKANIISAAGGSPSAPAELQAYCQAIAQAIVDQIQGSAVVIPSSLIAPSGGGPVTGTGTVD